MTFNGRVKNTGIVLGMINLFLFVVISAIFLRMLFSDMLDSELRRRLRVQYLEPLIKKLDVSYLFFNTWESGLPQYEISIKPSKYDEIMNERDKKISDRYFEFDDKKCEFFAYGKKYKAKVKLRGMLSNHWMEKKKSWSVKFDREDLFKGKRRINLIIPSDRDYLKEHLAYHTAKKFGLVVPDSEFIVLKINGSLQGVYFQVDQMGKEYLSQNYKPENSNIYDGEDSYLESNIFKDLAYWSKIRSDKNSIFENYSDIDKLLSVLNSENDEEFYNSIPIIADVGKFLAWNANSMLYFDYHQDNFHNMRLVFSPITGKFEPLIWDCSHPVYDPDIDRVYNDLVARLLMKPEYIHERNKILWRYLSDPENIKDDISFFDETLRKTRTAFLGDYRKNISNLRFIYVMKSLRRDIKTYYGHLMSKLSDAWVHGVVHFDTGKKDVFAAIKLKTGGFSAASLDSISVAYEGKGAIFSLYRDNNMDGALQDSDVFLGDLSSGVDGTYMINGIGMIMYPSRKVLGNHLMPEVQEYGLLLVTKEGDLSGYADVRLGVSNAVTGNSVEPVVKGVRDSDFSMFESSFMTPNEFIGKHSFLGLEKSGEGNELSVPAGTYEITRTLIVPRDVTLRISPSVTFRLSPGVSFLSYGRIIATGDEKAPIVFEGAVEDRPWGVFAIVDSGADGSVFDYLKVKGGGEAFINGIYFTGAMAIHGASAEVSNCVFEGNTGDDALNVKHKYADVKLCLFERNSMDALDLDYVSEGEVRDCIFRENGNDSIDLGSSSVKIIGNVIEQSGDKGVSLGEGSRAVIFNTSISGCSLGLGVKDNSEVVVINSNIFDNAIGIASYMKKGWWQKSGDISVYNSLLRNKKDLDVAGDAVVEIRNSMVSDDKISNESKGVIVFTSDKAKNIKGDKGIVLQFLPGEDVERVGVGIL